MHKKVDLPSANEYQIEQCKIFSEYVIDGSISTYRSRGSNNKEKILKDIYYGKVAECMVWNYLEEDGKKPCPVDFTIYSKKRKSFDCDILVDESMVHVKSCLSSSVYPNSWLFQKHDPVVTSPNDWDYFFLSVIDDESSGYSYVLKSNKVEYKEPIAFPLRRTKVAVYERDFA